MLKVKDVIKGGTILYPERLIKDPIISVIMPTYCRGKTSLKKAITSVLGQTFKPFELIIIDDGSWDGTLDILKRFQRKDSRIIIIRHDKNSGVPAIRVNEGILLARGKYISYQFDDDEWLPHCLEKLYKRRRLNGKPCLVYGRCELTLKRPGQSDYVITLGDEDYTPERLYSDNYISNNCVLHDKEIVHVCGLYDPHLILRRSCDYDLWLRISKKFPIVWAPEILTKVTAGGEKALGTDIDIDIIKYPNVRKYVEMDRDDKLLPKNIDEYRFDDIFQYASYFSPAEMYHIITQVVFPYIYQTPYYYKTMEKLLVAKKQPNSVLVTSERYNNLLDSVMDLNHKQSGAFKFYYVNEGALPYVSKEDFDILLGYHPTNHTAIELVNNNGDKPFVLIEDENKVLNEEALTRSNRLYLRDKAQVKVNWPLSDLQLINYMEGAKFKKYVKRGKMVFGIRNDEDREIAKKYCKALESYGIKTDISLLNTMNLIDYSDISYMHLFYGDIEIVKRCKELNIPVTLTVKAYDQQQRYDMVDGIHCFNIRDKVQLMKRLNKPIHRFMYPQLNLYGSGELNKIAIYVEGNKQEDITNIASIVQYLCHNFSFYIVTNDVESVKELKNAKVYGRDALGEVMNECGIYIHYATQSNHELLLAMSKGLMTICKDTGLSREIVKEHINGLMVSQMKPEDIAIQLTELLSMSEKQSKNILLRGRELINILCNEELIAYELLYLYNETIKNS